MGRGRPSQRPWRAALPSKVAAAMQQLQKVRRHPVRSLLQESLVNHCVVDLLPAQFQARGGQRQAVNRERSRRHARAAAQHHSTHARQPPAARSWSQRISNTASRRSNTARSRSNTASRRSGGSRRSSCTL